MRNVIDEKISAHDAAQLELRQPLPFPEPGSESHYTAETWFFIPASLNINRYTFPKSHFYRALKNYIRLQAPKIPLAKLTGPGSVFELVEERLAALPNPFDDGRLTDEERHFLSRLERRAKLFCLSFKQAMHDEAKDAMTRADIAAMDRFVARVDAILDAVWKLGDFFAGESPAFLSPLKEYCGNAAEYRCLVLLRYLQRQEENDDARRVAVAIEELIRKDEARRRDLSPDAVASLGGENEAFMGRLNTLKKYVNRPLFLEIHSRKEGKLIQHVAYSIAAALAMIFATLIAFLWQAKYGAISLPLFVALVISYIFKDRLKDILRDYMTNLFARRVSDRSLSIYQGNSSIGTCRELFDFLEIRHLSPEIKVLREVAGSDLPFFTAAEEIMYYRKRIVLSRGSTEGIDTRGILDITRLNLSELARNMDGNAEKLLALEVTESGPHCRLASGIKTYPVFIVRRHTYDGAQSYTMFRLVMDHTGVRRFEKMHGEG